MLQKCTPSLPTQPGFVDQAARMNNVLRNYS